MDVLSGLLLFFIPFFLVCLCSMCCRRKQRGIIFSNNHFPWGLVLFILVIILFSMCTHCCRTERGAIYRTPVVVTSATHTAPGAYPGAVQTTTVYPTSSSGYQQVAYPQQAYPQQAYPQQAPYPVMGVPTAMPMPMQQAQTQPNPMGINPQVMPPYPPTSAPYAAPYPPAANYSMNPPSYDSAVGPNQTGYEKQMPYNPGYTSQY